MKINRASRLAPLISCAAIALLASCSAPEVVPPTPRPVARPAPPPPPLPAQPAPKDWRDAMQTPGNWTYSSGTARYGSSGGPLFTLACNRTQGTVSLIRTGSSAASLPMTVATTSMTQTLSVDPAAGGQPQLVATLRAGDPLLDAVVFSRGRFAIEVNGLPTLYLPAWAEIGRVVEDCRGR